MWLCFHSCPLRQQNYDHAMYLLTVLYHESWVSWFSQSCCLIPTLLKDIKLIDTNWYQSCSWRVECTSKALCILNSQQLAVFLSSQTWIFQGFHCILCVHFTKGLLTAVFPGSTQCTMGESTCVFNCIRNRSLFRPWWWMTSFTYSTHLSL